MAGLLAVAPARANASVITDLVCAGAALEVCVNFDLTQVSGNNYQLVVTFQSSTGAIGQQGAMRAAGLYDQTGALSFTNVTVKGTTTGDNWSTGCQPLAGNSYAWACGSANSSSSDLIPLGGSVTITFTSSALISASDFSSTGNLGFRSMIQQLGPLSCSIKPDSRSPDGTLGGVSTTNADCSVTPEPVSMLLLGTGLAGITGMGFVRRRRREDDASV